MKCSFLLFFLFILLRVDAQKNTLDLSGYSVEKMEYESGNKNIDSSKLIKRGNQNQIRLSFFSIFDDSVILYINKKKIWSGSIYKKNNPAISSDWCGFDLNFLLKGSSNIATIKLISQKKYIQYKISQKFPLYMIQRYNNIWYIRSLKNTIEIK